MGRASLLVFFFGVLALPLWATGAGTGDGAASVARVRANLHAERPDLDVGAIRPSAVDGLYEVTSGGRIYYITADARYLFTGNLIDLRNQRNLTRERQASAAHRVINRIDPDRMLVFKPARGPATHTLTIFTDTSCPYCRALHHQVLSLVADYPVEVRYLLFPRAGVDSAAADTLRNVWCADDPNEALTRVFSGKSVAQRAAGCSTPIERDVAAGMKIGVSGTPFIIVDDDGPIVAGYKPARQLLAMMGLRPGGAADHSARR